MTPKEKRARAKDYAVGENCKRSFGVDQVEVADHWLNGFNAGYKHARDELFAHLNPNFDGKRLRLIARAGRPV